MRQRVNPSCLLITGLFAASFTVLSCVQRTETVADTKEAVPATTISDADPVSRGKYLVNAIGCDDCHSPKRMTPQGHPEIISEKRFGGYSAESGIPKAGSDVKGPWILFTPDLTASIGPWGMSFAANISSDETGIGNWTEEQFFRAMREGKSKGLSANRDLLPPMPWPSYGKLNDDDLKAIFAYLKTTNPVSNIVPQPIPPDKFLQ